MHDTAGTFLASLRKAHHKRDPFDYWLLGDVFPAAVCDEIAALPFSPPAGPVSEGMRETDSRRVFFTPENQERFPVCREVVDAFLNPRIMRAIERITRTDLTRSRLRIAYSQDIDGYWRGPHVDVPVKLFSMQVYLSHAPELDDAGTDIFDPSPDHKRVATAHHEWNTGLIFIPRDNTWHGFSRRPISGVRKSVIINYVAPGWRDVEDLA